MSSSRRNAYLVLAITLAAGLFVLVPTTRAARTYHVSTTGSDASAGTEAAPFRTVKKGISVLDAGDTLRVHGGTYQESVDLRVAPGTPGARVTVAAVAGEHPVVKGGLRITAPSYWTFDGINVTSNGTKSSSSSLVRLIDGDGWAFKNAEVWDSRGSRAVMISGRARGWTFAQNCVRDAGAGRSSNRSRHLVVAATEGAALGVIERNILLNAPQGDGVKLGGSSLAPVWGVTVRNNTVFNARQAVSLAASAHDNAVYGNLVAKSGPNDAGGTLISHYSASTANNIAANNLGYAAFGDGGLLKGLDDGGGNLYPHDPKFDSTSSCAGFHPQDVVAREFGRYANLTTIGTPPPTTAPSTTTTTPPPTVRTTTTVHTTTTVPRPTNCVTLTSGQPDIDARPAGTHYCVPAGAHAWSLRPKSGDTYTGQPGAALDGGGRIVHAYSGGAANVTVQSLEIRNYVPSSQNGMIQPDVRAPGWVLRNLNVHDSLHAGIKASDGMLITGGRVWRNGMLGIAGTSANDVTIDGVEIDGNNSRNLSHGFESGGVKWVGDRMVIRNSFIHHNRGPGLWADINGDNALMEGNRVEDNENEGIFFEISNHAVIRNNVVNRNGLIKHEWLWGGGITIASSGNVEIYGNTLSGNGNGITGTQQNRPDSGGNHLLRDMFVHDNTVSGSGRSDVVEDNGDNLATRNIRFVNNHYLAGHQGRVG